MPDKEFVLEWIRYATGDLTVARYLLEDLWPRETEISAWHCQQCAEKALKAFLVANDIEPLKINNLVELAKLCGKIDGDFLELQDDCEKINPYGVASRYPMEIAVDEPIAKALINKAQTVYDFCIARINALWEGAAGNEGAGN